MWSWYRYINRALLFCRHLLRRRQNYARDIEASKYFINYGCAWVILLNPFSRFRSKESYVYHLAKSNLFSLQCCRSCLALVHAFARFFSFQRKKAPATRHETCAAHRRHAPGVVSYKIYAPSTFLWQTVACHITMAGLRWVYKHRYLVLVWSELEILLFSAIVFGWASLVIVLKQDDIFRDLCESKPKGNSTSIIGDCSTRYVDEELDLAFLVGILSFTGTGVVSGPFLDRFGPRKTRLLSR